MMMKEGKKEDFTNHNKKLIEDKENRKKRCFYQSMAEEQDQINYALDSKKRRRIE